MSAAEPSVVFLGSGPVASRSLELLSQHRVIEAVITKSSTETLLAAAAPEGTPVLIANSKAELDRLLAQQQFTSPAGVVIDYGVLISAEAIARFPRGIINSHFSLLPDLRGADPITFAILSGQAKTGVSLMRIDEGLDTGDILAIGEHPLSGHETGPSLTEDLILLSDALLSHELDRYLSGDAKPVPQHVLPEQVPGYPSQPTYSRKLTKTDALLDPIHKSAVELEREVRAFAEWPKSRLQIGNKDVVITSSLVAKQQIGNAGEIRRDGQRILLQTTENCLDLTGLKPAGKKEMTAVAFLAGYGHLLPSI